jgi:hypothetical protein
MRLIETPYRNVRIVGAHELLNRRRLREQVAERDASMRRLGAREADGDASRRHRIAADHDERVISVERSAEVLTRRFPVEWALDRRGRHGVPAMM